jgi:hypothetical protein
LIGICRKRIVSDRTVGHNNIVLSRSTVTEAYLLELRRRDLHRAPGPAFKADVPYAVLLIDLEEGPRMISIL